MRPKFFCVIFLAFLVGVGVKMSAHGQAVLSGVEGQDFWEVYIRFQPAYDLPRKCASVLAWLKVNDAPQGDIKCVVMRGDNPAFRLRWQLVDRSMLAVWLKNQRENEFLLWYEFHQKDMSLQSLTSSLSVAQPILGWNGLVESDRRQEDPVFINADIRKIRAWLHIYPPVRKITVAVIDSGVNFAAPRLAGLQWTNPGEVSGNGQDDDGNGYLDDVHGWDFVEENYKGWLDDTTIPDNDPGDFLGHGTIVANIISAVAGPDAVNWLRIMPLRVASGKGGLGSVSPFALAQAIEYAVYNGADVINLSIGGAENYQVVRDAIDSALGRGVKIISAAGNSSGDVLFPANVPGVMAVGALDAQGEIWSQSAKGNDVDVYARGTDMMKSLGLSVAGLSESGTSYAAPVVSGLAAMFFSVHQKSEVNNFCGNSKMRLVDWRANDQGLTSWLQAMMFFRQKDLQNSESIEVDWENNRPTCGVMTSVSTLLRQVAK